MKNDKNKLPQKSVPKSNRKQNENVCEFLEKINKIKTESFEESESKVFFYPEFWISDVSIFIIEIKILYLKCVLYVFNSKDIKVITKQILLSNR